MSTTPNRPSMHATLPAPDGVAVRSGDGTVLRFERRLAHPVRRVWTALTEPHELRGWLADADVDLREGGAVELRWLNTDHEGNRAVARGTIVRLRRERVLEIDTDIHGRLLWELFDEGDGTLLAFTCTTAAPSEFITLVTAGWHIHLEHLADLLDHGARVDWPNWDREHLPRWEELKARYDARRT